jgi:transposase-like protein
MKPQTSLKKSPGKPPAKRMVKDIRRQTRRHFSAEDKIRIVLDGLRGEDSIAELCRKEGIAQSLYYTWSVRRQHQWHRFEVGIKEVWGFVVDEGTKMKPQTSLKKSPGKPLLSGW